MELRLYHPGPTLTTKDTDIDMDVDDKVKCHTIEPTTTLPDATYHCTNLFDLVAVLRRLTPAQRHAIQTFKIRWYTAECALWEYYHPEHSCRVLSSAFKMLTGLRKVVVDYEGKDAQQVRKLKVDLEEWIGGRADVEMVGGKKAVKANKWLGWGNGGMGGDWSFGKLGT